MQFKGLSVIDRVYPAAHFCGDRALFLHIMQICFLCGTVVGHFRMPHNARHQYDFGTSA